MHPPAPSHIPLCVAPLGLAPTSCWPALPWDSEDVGIRRCAPVLAPPSPTRELTLLSLISPPGKGDHTSSCRGLAGPACTPLSSTQQDLVQEAHVPGPVPGRCGVGAGHRSEHTDRASHAHAADAPGCSSQRRGSSVSRRPPGRGDMCLVFTKLGAGLLLASTGWRARPLLTHGTGARRE